MGQKLGAVRKLKGVNQADMAALLGIGQSTYQYKEQHGTFTEAEMAKIAKYLKVDMQYIVWKSTAVKVSDESQTKLQELRQRIIELEAQNKTLQEMIAKMLEKFGSQNR